MSQPAEELPFEQWDGGTHDLEPTWAFVKTSTARPVAYKRAKTASMPKLKPQVIPVGGAR